MRAKGTLRSIGSCQLAYQKTNNGKLYGSFEALKRDQYINEGCTLGNMIDNYTMTWEVSNVSTVTTEEMAGGTSSAFTIIAWPRDTRPGFLNTFGVTDDQIVRVYNPTNENDLSKVKTWDPIL